MKRYPEILITGGTSGLGLELVKVFLIKGYFVTATGRDSSKLPEGYDNLEFAHADFGDLRKTATDIKDLCKTHDFDYVINNAGILSPPDYTLSNDGIEITFQINFLAHLLVDEIIMKSRTNKTPLRFFSVTSPVYRLTSSKLIINGEEKDYKPVSVYSESKLLLVLMSGYLKGKYLNEPFSFVCFDPGIFGSGIFRTQSPVFKFLYKIAVPFMKKPSAIASDFFRLIENNSLVNGAVYNSKQKTRILPEINGDLLSSFWNRIYDLIAQYI